MGPGDPIVHKGYERTDASKEVNLEKVHAWISKKNPKFKVPFSEFVTDMRDEQKFINTYNYIKSNNPEFQKDYDSFAGDMGYTLKKKSTQDTSRILLPGEVDLSKPVESGLVTDSVGQPVDSSQLEQQLLTHPPVDQVLPDFAQQSIPEIEQQFKQNVPAMVLPQDQKQQAFDRPGVDLPVTPQQIKENVAYYKAKRDEQHLAQGFGLEERPHTVGEHAGHMAGQFNKAVVDMFSSFPKSVAIGAQALDRITGDDRPIEDYATFKAGKWLDEKAAQIGITATNPDMQDSFWESTIPSAFGSVLGLVLTGGGGASEKAGIQLLNQSPKLAPAALEATKELGGLLTSNLAISAGLTQGVQEFQQAKNAGSTDEDAFKVFLKNYGVGLTEVVPISMALDRINKFSKGGVIKALSNMTSGALEEGIQEGIQQYLTNKIAQGSYDPKREGFEDMISSIGAGAFVGFVLPGVGAAIEHMTPEQKIQTKQIIHDALLKEQAKPEQTVKAPSGDLGKQTTKVKEPVKQAVEKPGIPEGNPRILQIDKELNALYEKYKDRKEGDVKPKEITDLETEHKKLTSEDKIPVGEIFKNPLKKSKWRTGDYRSKGIDKRISINDIAPTQETIQKGFIKDDRFKPSVEKEGDLYLVQDGHHRIAEAILNGEKFIDVSVNYTKKSEYEAELKSKQQEKPDPIKVENPEVQKEVATPDDLQDRGEEVPTTLVAKTRFGNGDRIFAYPDQDGETEPVELFSVETIDKYTADQLLAYPKQQENVPEQSTTALPLLEQAGDSKKVEQGVPEPGLKEPAGAQGGQTTSEIQKEKPVTDSSTDEKIITQISDLIGNEKLGKKDIEAIGKEHGIEDKNKIKELTELAVVRKARELAAKDDFTGLVKLYNDQPNLTHRTNESIEKQQYSTPAPIAYTAGKYVNADQNESNFEPSAGNGMLTIVGDPKTYTVNEIDEVRLKNLNTQGFAKVLTQSGAEEFNTPKTHDAVITNPPFGTTKPTEISGYKLSELAQIMSIRALNTMKDNGKASIIIGGNNKYDDQGRMMGRDRIYFNYLYNNYNVEDVIDVTGDLYRKQGASFPIRVILINGRKATPEGVAPTKEAFGTQVKSFEELKERVDKHLTSKNENIQPAELVGGPAGAPISGGTRPGAKTQPTTNDAVPEKPVHETGKGDETPKPSPVRSGPVTNSGAKPGPGSDSGVNPDQPALHEQPAEQGPAEQQQPGQPEGVEGNAEPRPKRDRKTSVGNESGESTVEYKPVSTGKSLVVSTPASLQQEMNDAQTDLENEVGKIDEFVRQKLGYKSIEEMHEGLAAEQIDSIALAIRNIERGTGMIIGDQPGLGKGRSQPLTSNILTDTGWKLMGDIKIGQFVIGGDGQKTKVIGVYPQGEIDVYEIVFSDGSRTECSEDHLWLTIDNDQKTYLKNDPDRLKIYAQWKVKTTKELIKNIRKRFSIPMVIPVSFLKQDIPIDPYLLGVLLGDAHLREKGIELTCADDQILQSVNRLVGYGMQVRYNRKYHYQIAKKPVTQISNRTKKEVVYRGGPNPLLDAIRSLGLSGKIADTKFIPESYKINSIENRLAILQGLMDTDGYINVSGSCMYYTVSAQLANDIDFIVRSLGGTTTRGTKKPTYTYKGEKKAGKLCHVIYIKLPNQFSPFRLERKKARCKDFTKYPPNRLIKSIKKIGKKECQCIKVDNPTSLYVTDDFIVTHNTAAGIVRYANQQGKAPIFLTKSAYLFTNFYGDLKDIGYGHIKPYIFNSRDATKFPAIFDADGKILHTVPSTGVSKRPVPKDARIILATYSQFSSERYKDKIDLFRNLAAGNIIIMDESHMASGDDSNTSRIFQEVLPSVKGVVYLSGTYAKRASSMPVYALKTSMREANMEPSELIEAIKKGGNPLQEINASILTETGEMIRRERTFKGIEVNTHVIGGDNPTIKDRQIKQSDAVTEVMREIIDFQKVFVNPVVKQMDSQQKGGKVKGRKGADLGSVTSSPYFQKVFNVINQLLYSIKAKDTAQLIIDELKAGRKPFLAVRSTMEAMLNDMVERGELKIGDPVNSDFSFVIRKGLEGVLRITREDAQGNKIYENIPPSALSSQGQMEYKRLLSRIANLKTGLTLSPIDEILKNLADAGVRVAEITGRKIRVDFKGDNAYLETNKKLSINEAYRKYNSGEIDVLIVNRSGSTGASAHASEKVKDQRPRTMFVLENELDISELVQILFRINRSGQVNLPKYVFVSSSIPAEQRLGMMMMRKLKSLDANTTSNQKQSKGLVEVPEIFNKYGDQVVLEYLNDNPDIDTELGHPVDSHANDAGEMVPEEGAANKVTGKIAVLSAEKQAAFYSDITERYTKYLDFLNEAGMNDLVIENLPLKAKTIKKESTIVGNGGRSAFGNDTFLEDVEVNVLKKPMTKAEITHQIKELGSGEKIEEYNKALDVYADTLAEKTQTSVNERFDKKVAAIEKDTTLTTEIKAQEIEGINNERNLFMQGKVSADDSKIQYIKGLLRFFKPGQAVMVPNDYLDMRNGGTRPAIFIGFDIDLSKPKAFLPSNVTLKFAINDSRRTLTLPASRDNLVNTIREFSYSLSESFKSGTLDEWDKLKKPKDRERRLMVTGNILQGLGNESYRKGNIVKYSTEDGFINTGILLPESFDLAEEGVTDTVSVPAKKAIDIVLQLPVGKSIQSIDESVTITKGQTRFSIRVPLPKQTGGKYYLNEELKKIVQGGRWDSVGLSMEAFIDDSRLGELMTALSNQFSTSFMVNKKQLKGGTDGFTGMMRPEGKATSLDEIKPRVKKVGVKPFNMADRVKDVFKKHDVPINEGALRKKYAGVYKHMTGGVRVQSLWDLFVASHEMTHALDQRNNISNRIQSQGTQKLKSEFLHAYENLYPDPKKTASLNERIQEGMAMVVELYLNDPQMAQAKYPEIVKHLLTPGGQFHKQEMTDFLNEMRAITDDYYSLNPEEKINSRIKWDGTNKEGGVSTKIQVIHALTNDLITANMVDELMGGELRAKAITPNVTMLRGIANIAGNWIRKPFGATDAPQTYVGNGMWARKKSPYRVEDLLDNLKTIEEITKFSDWLVARRQYSDYLRLDNIKDEIDNGNTDLQPYYDELTKIVENNQMPRDLVESVYYKFESQYQKPADIYDAINRDMVDFMEATELISKEKGDEYRASAGYAAFQRFIEDDQQNIESLNLSTGTKSKLAQLRTRSGSSLQILPPVYSQIVAVGEVLRRGQLNLVWKAWADAAKDNKEVAKMFEPVAPLDVKDQKDFQPVWEKGVQKWYKLSEESRMFAQALSPDQVDLFFIFLRGVSRFGQAMTTTFFAPFMAMNIPIDAVTRFMNTKTGLIPGLHDVKTVKNAMVGLAHWMGMLQKNAPNDFEKYMALGGRKQTLAGNMQLNPQEAIESVLNSDWVYRTKDGFEKTLKIVESPVNMTELIARGTEFQRALAQGYPTNVAMHMASEVSIPFSNKGSVGTNWMRSVMFMGAGIQAFAKFIKTAKDNPKRMAMAVGILTTVATTGALATYLYGDDDEKMQLANQEPEELARFIFLPASIFGLKSGLIKIRIGEQGGNVVAAVQLYYQHLFMKRGLKFSDFYRSQEVALPAQLHFSQGLGLVGSWLPQAFSPAIQVMTNTRFYPHMAPIVPEWMDDLDEYAQYDKYTSRTARAIGMITRDSFMELSPKKVDFFIRAQFGRTSSLIIGLAESAVFGDPMKTYVNIFEEADRFMLTGRVYNKFYELLDEAKSEYLALKKMPSVRPDLVDAAKIRLGELEEVHKDLSDMSDRMYNNTQVPLAERRMMFRRLQTVTRD